MAQSLRNKATNISKEFNIAISYNNTNVLNFGHLKNFRLSLTNGLLPIDEDGILSGSNPKRIRRNNIGLVRVVAALTLFLNT